MRLAVVANGYGVAVSLHRCSHCGASFTVTPAVDKSWGLGCLGEGEVVTRAGIHFDKARRVSRLEEHVDVSRRPYEQPRRSSHPVPTSAQSKHRPSLMRRSGRGGRLLPRLSRLLAFRC